MSAKKYDLIILGAGVVGLTIANLINKSGLSCAIIEEKKIDFFEDEQKEEELWRAIAINRSSEQIFREVKAWELIDPDLYCAYKKICVFEEQNLAELEFDAKDISESNLGYIIPNPLIIQALYRRLKSSAHCDFLFGKKPQAFIVDEKQIELNLESGENLASKLIVGADGSHSWVRGQCEITADVYDYAQHAIVATIQIEKPHHRVAYQRFLVDGIFALLPLPDSHRSSLVWSLPSEKAKMLKHASSDEFNDMLMKAFSPRLGTLKAISPRHIFPLKKTHAKSYVQPRIALVGDAIHTIHPLAGQGLNLGISDAASLARILSQAFEQQKDIGSIHVLRQFERERRFENTVMGYSMDALKSFFSYQQGPFSLIHRLSLGAIQNFLPLRSMLMRKALGY